MAHQGRDPVDPLDRTATLTVSRDGDYVPPSPSHDSASLGYEIHGEHARGGLGRVLRADDRRLGRPVAIKELLRRGQDSSVRFLREVQLTARLQHPGIVPIYEAGQWSDGTPFYVMKFIDGATLKTLLRERPALDERIGLLPKLIAVVETMAYVHRERVIHRDLKPANVLVGPFGETVIVDWGVAKAIDAPRNQADAAPYRRSGEDGTLDGAVLGTPAYMPPEQARGEIATTRSDVYSLGAMLYEVLVGAPPYRGDSSADVLKQVLTAPPRPIEELAPAAPRELVTIVQKAMARDPAQRYADAGDLAEDLLHFQAGRLVRAHEYSRAALVARWVARNRRVVGVAVGALVVLALFAVASVERIVRERNRAEARGRDLILAQAQAQLEIDPTAAVAWAKTYPPRHGDDALRALLVDAESRGVARHVFLRGSPVISYAAVSHDGTRLATQDEPDWLRISDLTTGRALVRVRHGGIGYVVAWSDDDRAVVVGNRLRARETALEVVDVATGTVTALGRVGYGAEALDVRGDRVLVGGTDGSVELWSLATHARQRIAKHDGRVFDVHFSPDGANVVAVGADARVSIYDIAAGTLRTFAASAKVYATVFTPDGRHVVGAQQDGAVVIWALDGSARLLGRHDAAAIAVAVSQDGKWLATGSEDKTVRLWDLGAGGGARVLTGHDGIVAGLAFSPDGRFVVSGGGDATVRVWDVATGSDRVLRGHKAAVEQILFTPNGQFVISAAEDRATRVWDLAAARDTRELIGHRGRVLAVVASLDGRLVATRGYDRTVRIWDVASRRQLHVLDEHDRVGPIAFSPDGRQLAVAVEGAVVVHDVLTGAELRRTTQAPAVTFTDLQFARDGRRLAAVAVDGVLRVWTGESLQTFRGSGAPLRAVAFSRDGGTIAAGGDDGTVRAWTLDGGAERRIDHHEEGVAAIVFSPARDEIAYSFWNHTLVVRNLGTGVEKTSQLADNVSALSYSPSGDWLAAAGSNGLVVMSNRRDGTERQLAGHAGDIVKVAFSRDERLLATAGWDDHAVRLWDVASGQPLELQRTSSIVYDVEFVGDELVMAACHDGIVRGWPIEPLRHALAEGPHERMQALTTATLLESRRTVATE